MAKESSFDVVSELDLQEVRNAVDQARREISTRFDFKGTRTSVELAEQTGVGTIVVRSETEQKVKDALRVVQEKLARRRVDLKALRPGRIEPAAGGTARLSVELVQGIPQDKAREIVRTVKDLKLKVQPAVQGDRIRVSSHSRDALQQVIAELRGRDFGIPLQFTNYR